MEKIEHLYSQNQLEWFLDEYNEVLKYLKLTWEFWVNDKIVGLKRWLFFSKSDSVFWDYLDAVHKPAKQLLGKKWWLHCIKFVLDNWKEVIIAELEKPGQKLPAWMHSLEEYIWKLKNTAWERYIPDIFKTLWTIKTNEFEYFNSKEYKDKQKKTDMFAILNLN